MTVPAPSIAGKRTLLRLMGSGRALPASSAMQGHLLRGEERGPQAGGMGPHWHQEPWGKRADGQEEGPVGGAAGDMGSHWSHRH